MDQARGNKGESNVAMSDLDEDDVLLDDLADLPLDASFDFDN